MCCIFSCCVWTLDVIQRVLTFLLACILAAMVVLILGVAIVVGVAYGYNYSMAEFISLGKTDVTVFMRRGQFSDADDRDHDRPPIFAERRRFENVFPEGSAVDINNLIPDAAGKARALVDSWEQAKEARKYDGILSRFTPRKSKYNEEIEMTDSSPVSNLRVMDKHETIFFDQENQSQDDFYIETTKSESVRIKHTKKILSTEHRIMDKSKPQTPTFLKEKKQDQDDFYIDFPKSSTVTKTTKRSPSSERHITKKLKHNSLTLFDGKKRGHDGIEHLISKTVTKTTKKSPSTKRRIMEKPLIPTHLDEEDRSQDDFHTESMKSETAKVKSTQKSPSTGNRVMEKFKPLYVEEDNQDRYNSQEKDTKSRKMIIKTTNKWSSTKITKKATNVEEINRKQYTDYKTSKSKVVTVKTTKKTPDIKIRVGSINFDIPENEKYKILEQNSDENEDYSESDEEDRVVKAIQEEEKRLDNEKAQQTIGRRIPDIKIRVGKFSYHTTSQKIKTTGMRLLNTVYTKNYKSAPDIKIQVESKASKDKNELDKNNQKTIIETMQKENYEEKKYSKSTNGKFQTLDKSKIPDIKIQIESNDYYERDKNNNTSVLKPQEKEYYEESIYRKTMAGRFQTVDKSRTREKVDVKSKDYYEPYKNNNEGVVGPMEEEYDERFDRKTLSWGSRTVERVKFDDGATRHPYKMEQPPHPYREEDDDVLYKPV